MQTFTIIVKSTLAKEDKDDNKENIYFTTPSNPGLASCVATMTFEKTISDGSITISDIHFKGRPSQPTTPKNKTQAIAHINPVSEIKKEIINKFKNKNVTECAFATRKLCFTNDPDEMEILTLKYYAQQITHDLVIQCKERSNAYASDATHNQFLNWMNLKLFNQNQKYPGKPINCKIDKPEYLTIAKEKWPNNINKNTLIIDNAKTFNLIQSECKIDKPENNPEVKKREKYWDTLSDVNNNTTKQKINPGKVAGATFNVKKNSNSPDSSSEENSFEQKFTFRLNSSSSSSSS